MIDSHCHLADEVFAPDLVEVAGRARAAGVSDALCILSADEPGELARTKIVRDVWPSIRFAAAIHPHRSGPYARRLADAIRVTREAVTKTGASAIGEIGLDYHYDFAPRSVQRDVFAAQLSLAVETGKPVIIHTREATEDTMALLREAGQARVRGVMHCFSGTVDDARQALDIGFFISLAGILTFPKAPELREVASLVPIDRLLVETDAPFLAPVPYRGKRNEPAWVVHTAAALAAARDESPDVINAALDANFRAFIGAAAERGTAAT
jgi:TatD DNase family protein